MRKAFIVSVLLLWSAPVFADPPGGNDKEIQYNDNGAFAGVSNGATTPTLQYDKTRDALTAKNLSNIIYVEGYATCDAPGPCGTEASPWKAIDYANDKTGGIKSALAMCTPADAGCVIVLPKGYVKVEETIEIGGSQRRVGLIVTGHGSGFKSFPTGTFSFAGTTLVWSSLANAPVLRVKSVAHSVFENFSIDGGGDGASSPMTAPELGTGPASVGIEYSADNTVLGSQSNIFRNINIDDINHFGSAGIGYGIKIVPTTADQIDKTTFEDIHIRRVGTGIFQDGGQTAENRFNKIQVLWFTKYGMDFEEGPIHTYQCMFGGDAPSSEADIRIGQNAFWAVFNENYHETKNGTTYEFDGTAPERNQPTTLIGTRVQWLQDSGRIIDYQQAGPLNLIGCDFDIDSDGAVGEIYVKTPPGATGTARVLSLGNTYEKQSGGGGVIVEIIDSTLVSNDDPLQLGGQVTGWVTHHHKRAAMLFEDSDFTWSQVDPSLEEYAFRKYLNGSILKLEASDDYDVATPSWDQIAGWTTSGRLTFDKSFGGVVLEAPDTTVTFEGAGADDGIKTTLVAATQTVNQTVTLPDKTGTVLVSGNTLQGDVTGVLADGATTVTVADSAIEPSDVNASNSGAQGDCLTLSTGDQFSWQSCSGQTPVCGSATVDPQGIAGYSSGEIDVTATGVLANDACSCAPRADWHDDLLMKYCSVSTTDQLTVRFYNARKQFLDAGAQTLDYCCLR